MINDQKYKGRGELNYLVIMRTLKMKKVAGKNLVEIFGNHGKSRCIMVTENIHRILGTMQKTRGQKVRMKSCDGAPMTM